MSGIASEVDAVIAARRKLLPEVQAEITSWRRADEAVVALDQALAELCDYKATPNEIVEPLSRLRVSDVRLAITTVIEQLQRVEARVSRNTVNIAVSGGARVGKTTLLQSISGLDDAQLPTGSGIPVTAVRSRVYHTPGRRRAMLELHTFDTFRAAHLQPRHAELGLTATPTDLAEYRAWKYPLPGERPDFTPTQVKYLTDLREMQATLPSYEGLLDRGSHALELTGDELDGLRAYVAYPSHDEKKAKSQVHRYLAVRDIRVECAFPHGDMGSVGIADLPGTGEIRVDGERHHVEGLRHEVDVALVVKRAVAGMSYWGETDDRTITLLDKARGYVRRRGDFVFVVLNVGSCSTTLVENIRDDVRRSLNEGQDGLHRQVLEVDARDAADVSERVLRPVLCHLVERLPSMDGEILAGTRAHAETVRDRLVGLAVDVKAILHQVRGLTTGAAENLYQRADELHKNLAVILHGLLDELREQAMGRDPDYAAAVDRVYHDVLEWIYEGLGLGRERWCAEALRTMIVDGGAGEFVTAELNRVRVDLGRMFAELDLFFQDRVDEAWRQVSHGLAGELNGVLDGRSGHDALTYLAELAGEAAEPCAVMRASLTELLALRLDYRTQAHPRVRPELDALNPRVRDQVVVPATEEGAEELYQTISELGEQAAFRIRNALLREAALPGQVLFAAVEQFDDALVRSGAAEREIRQLARAYRDELWPGVFEGLDGADARVARAARVADEVLNAAAEFGNHDS